MTRIILLSLALFFITGSQINGQGDAEDGGGVDIIDPQPKGRFVPLVMVY